MRQRAFCEFQVNPIANLPLPQATIPSMGCGIEIFHDFLS